jgi:hypothetical protein
VFSEQAPRDIKVFYAFKIYGEKMFVSVLPFSESSCAVHIQMKLSLIAK